MFPLAFAVLPDSAPQRGRPQRQPRQGVAKICRSMPRLLKPQGIFSKSRLHYRHDVEPDDRMQE